MASYKVAQPLRLFCPASKNMWEWESIKFVAQPLRLFCPASQENRDEKNQKWVAQPLRLFCPASKIWTSSKEQICRTASAAVLSCLKNTFCKSVPFESHSLCGCSVLPQKDGVVVFTLSGSHSLCGCSVLPHTMNNATNAAFRRTASAAVLSCL